MARHSASCIHCCWQLSQRLVLHTRQRAGVPPLWAPVRARNTGGASDLPTNDGRGQFRYTAAYSLQIEGARSLILAGFAAADHGDIIIEMRRDLLEQNAVVAQRIPSARISRRQHRRRPAATFRNRVQPLGLHSASTPASLLIHIGPTSRRVQRPCVYCLALVIRRPQALGVTAEHTRGCICIDLG